MVSRENSLPLPPATANGEANARPNTGLRAIIITGLLFLLAPFWLPATLGGQVLYHYVVTESMTYSVDKGTLVIIWPQEAYAVGDVVAFKMDFGGISVPILHRVIARADTGEYLIKGDAATGTDVVRPEDVIGKMVVGIPYLGFVGGAAKFFPLLIAFFVLSPLFTSRQKPGGKGTSSPFLITAIVVMLTLPLASIGLAEVLGKPFAAILVIGALASARLTELAYKKELGSMTDVLYGMVAVASLSMVYVPDVVDSLKEFFRF